MVDKLPDNFTRDFIEAGYKLSELDRLRTRFLLAEGKPDWKAPQTNGAANLLAEILADPDKAAASQQFLDVQEHLGQAGESPRIYPWDSNLQGLAAKAPEGLLALSDSDIDGADILWDFQGRIQALLAGAAVNAAAQLTPELIYTHALDGRPILLTDGPDFDFTETSIKIPRQADKVLVLGFVRAPEIMGMNPGLSKLRPATGWLNWDEQISAVLQLAETLKSAGWLALPSAGGLLMADHHGALAGLGEIGRLGLLITPEYGPNLRLFTIITNYPFQVKGPAIFGVADYCETCQRCINECPAKALTEGHRRPGLYQWPVDRQACFENWRLNCLGLAADQDQDFNSSPGPDHQGQLFQKKQGPCRKCIEICPYTREPLVGSPGGAKKNDAPRD